MRCTLTLTTDFGDIDLSAYCLYSSGVAFWQFAGVPIGPANQRSWGL